MTSRRSIAALAIALAGILGLTVLLALRGPSEADRAATADALVAGIRTEVRVTSSRLLATRAVADFGVDEPVGLVLVRIADELGLEVRIESPAELPLAAPIVACLVGPDAAPDDAGLESPCWGEPDLGLLLEAALPRDADARLKLASGEPVTLTVALRRGDARCDYPPGSWHLRLRVDPVVEATPAGPRAAPDATFDVPFLRGEPLRLVGDRRYCGLASRVFREQGEPLIVSDE